MRRAVTVLRASGREHADAVLFYDRFRKVEGLSARLYDNAQASSCADRRTPRRIGTDSPACHPAHAAPCRRLAPLPDARVGAALSGGVTAALRSLEA